MKEILHSANVPKGSFHHHFGSKEDFAAATLEKYTARAAEHFVAFNDSKTLPLKRLKRYFSDLVKVTGQSGPIPGCMMGRFTLEIADEGPQLRKRIRTSFARWQHKIATVIEQAVTQKELPADTDPESLAFSCSTVGRGRSYVHKRKKATLEMFMHYVFDELLTKKRKS